MTNFLHTFGQKDMATTITSTPAYTEGGYTCRAFAVASPAEWVLTENSDTRLDGTAMYEEDGTTLIQECHAPIKYPSTDTLYLNMAGYAMPLLNSALPATDNPASNGIDNATYNEAHASALGLRFRFAYKVQGAGSYTVSSGNFLAVLCARQIADKYGNNLYYFMPKVNVSVQEAGRFLTTFERPVLWHYKNTVLLPALAFLNCGGLESFGLNAVQSFGTPDTSTLYGAPSVDQVCYASFFEASMGALLAKVQSASECSLQVKTFLGSVTAIAPITFEIREACSNPIFIKWKDALGSFHIWAFERNQTEARGAESIGEYTETATAFGGGTSRFQRNRTMKKQGKQSIELKAAHLTSDEWEALAGIFESPSVWLCVNDFDTDTVADKWLPVQVMGEAQRNRYDTTHKFACTIEVQRVTFGS